MAQQAPIETQREIVRELLKDPSLPAARMKSQLAARGISVAEAAVEQLRQIVAVILEEQARPRAVDGATLHALPVRGEIDHETLTREIIARFPNILAALAQ